MKLDSQILSYLFNYFNDSNVEYCVMNNYENMPEIIPTDVDFVIDKEAFKKLDSTLLQIASRHNVEIIQKIWHGYHKFAYILSPVQIDERFRLQLDFFVNFSAKGYPNLLPNRLLLDKRKKYKNFFIPEAEIELPFLFMRRIVKNDLTIEHIDKMKFLIEQDSINTKKNLEEIVGKAISNSIIKLTELRDKHIFKNQIGENRNALRKWSKKNTPFEYILKYGISQCNRIIQRLLHPVGFSIVLLGPDASGKSTIARLTLDRVSGSFHGLKLLHWRPSLLPAMRRLKIWDIQNQGGTNSRPHDHPQQNRFKSLIRFFYYLIDYIIGYQIKVYWAKVKKQIVFFDRYYYDVVVDPVRYGFNLPPWLIKSIMPLIPKPDLTIYLDNEPEELYKRKQELPVSELNRQVEAWREFIPSLPNARIVTTDKPLDDVVHEVTRKVLERRAEMTRKMLRIEPEASQFLWKSEIIDYVAFPSKKNCRWIIPTNPKLAKKAWDLYHPHSSKGKFYKNYQKYLGSISPFKTRKTISSDSLNSDKSKILRNKLVEILGTDDIVMAISTGTPSPFKKITGLVMSSDGIPQACVKIGETPLAISRIKNEARVLNKLFDTYNLSPITDNHSLISHEPSVMSIKIPELLYEGDIENAHVIIQSPAPFKGKSGNKYFNEDYGNILATLINNTSVINKFSESEFYRTLKEGIDNYSLSYKDVLENGLKYIEDTIGDKEVTFALCHGDFAPWNMIWNGKQPFIYDWESACFEAPAGLDLVHFLFQTGFLLKKLRDENLLRYIQQNTLLRSLPLTLPEVLIMLYSLYMAVTEDEPQQLSSAAVERRNLIQLIVYGL